MGGVFEGARCYDTPKGSVCFRLDAHLRRLYDSAKVYRMAYDLDLPGFHEAVLDTIRRTSPRLVVCGHIHGCWGQRSTEGRTLVLNAGPEGQVLELPDLGSPP